MQSPEVSSGKVLNYEYTGDWSLVPMSNTYIYMGEKKKSKNLPVIVHQFLFWRKTRVQMWAMVLIAFPWTVSYQRKPDKWLFLCINSRLRCLPLNALKMQVLYVLNKKSIAIIHGISVLHGRLQDDSETFDVCRMFIEHQRSQAEATSNLVAEVIGELLPPHPHPEP